MKDPSNELDEIETQIEKLQKELIIIKRDQSEFELEMLHLENLENNERRKYDKKFDQLKRDLDDPSES